MLSACQVLRTCVLSSFLSLIGIFIPIGTTASTPSVIEKGVCVGFLLVVWCAQDFTYFIHPHSFHWFYYFFNPLYDSFVGDLDLSVTLCWYTEELYNWVPNFSHILENLPSLNWKPLLVKICRSTPNCGRL